MTITKNTALIQKRNHRRPNVRSACSVLAGGSQSMISAWAAVIAATTTAMTASGMIGIFLYTARKPSRVTGPRRPPNKRDTTRVQGS